jgi:hypothetical protein
MRIRRSLLVAALLAALAGCGGDDRSARGPATTAGPAADPVPTRPSDFHNEQAYEASDAAMAALTDLEEECL